MVKAVLTKPVTPSSLLDAIGDSLGKKIAVERRQQDRQHTSQEAMRRLRGARLLLVEDNELNRELAEELLRQAGVEIVVATNGQDALDLLGEAGDFDGILMDCQMPVMDGYDATRAIRRDPALADIPIIAMTANAMVGDRERVLDAGMNDHIAKPLNVGDMYSTMAKWITPANRPEDQEMTDQPAADPDEVPELPGIDRKAGLAVCGGNTKLYRKLLVKFREGERDFEARFRAARDDGDAEVATRWAHTLKGTAGNIGARGVQAAAGELESACRKGAEDFDDRVVATVAALRPVIEGLEGLEGQAAGARAAGRVDLERMTPLLAQLRALLADDDAEALGVIEKLLEQPASGRHRTSLEAISRRIEDFDFAQALAELAKLEGLLAAS
jgi:CheY-like chemotaxis protein